MNCFNCFKGVEYTTYNVQVQKLNLNTSAKDLKSKKMAKEVLFNNFHMNVHTTGTRHLA